MKLIECGITQPEHAHRVRVWQSTETDISLVVMECQDCDLLQVMVGPNMDWGYVRHGNINAEHSWFLTGLSVEVSVKATTEAANFAEQLLSGNLESKDNPDKTRPDKDRPESG